MPRPDLNLPPAMARVSFWIALLALLNGAPTVAGFALCAALLAGFGWLVFGPSGRWR